MSVTGKSSSSIIFDFFLLCFRKKNKLESFAMFVSSGKKFQAEKARHYRAIGSDKSASLA